MSTGRRVIFSNINTMTVLRCILRLKPYRKPSKINSANYSTARSKGFINELPNYKEERIKIDNWYINYMRVGSGAHHVLCLPGAFGTMLTDFSEQMKGFDLDQFTLIGYDTPGFGKSSPPERDFSKDFFHTDADLFYKLMQTINIPKYSLMGWSYGGIVSLIHAAVYSDAVRKLVVCGSQSHILPQEVASYKKLKYSEFPAYLYNPRVELYGKEASARYWDQTLHTMASKYKHLDGDICSKLLKDIGCPTLILFGSGDSIVDVSHVSHMNAHIKKSKTYIYPKGGHNFHLCFPEDFNRRVQKFLLEPSDESDSRI